MEQLQSLTITIPGKLPTWNQLLAMNRWRRAAFDSPVSIRIDSYRIRLADVDGVSAKAVLDALVLAKVIANDTTKEVKEVLFSQTKVKNKDEEKVIVTVVRV